MTVAELIQLRHKLGLSQTRMARAMGLGLRALQDIEGQDGDEVLGDRHRLLAERCSLTMAVEQGNPMLAVPAIRREATALVKLWEERAA